MSMSTGVEPMIDVKVFVDKERGKVLFAESGKEFVDVLFGFLTLPLGTVVRLLGGQSQVGCLDELYRSVEGLSPDLFRTEACKAMLLKPINSAAKQCCQLPVRIDDTKHREVYVCGDTSCSVTAFSSVPGAVCECGMNKFIVTDDLNVAPASTSLMLSLLDKFQVPDPSCLEQMTLQFSSVKIIDLLRRSLTSQNPLTGHHLDVAVAPDDSVVDMLPDYLHPEQDNEAEHSLVNATLRVLQTKNNSKVLYAEVGGDFVDLLFGLLTVPLGSIAKNYGKSASKGCLENLYTSIAGSAEGCLRPECQNLLLSPMLVVIEAKLQRKDLVEKEVALTKPQVMELLTTAMVTRRALSTVLLPPIPKINKKLHYHSFGLY
ncbi:uncharacterized protein [Triticum aestivum]|uniref:uncharacterized protein n=1 Tax=Triticum aestivum TaxID=4565 RepID=UPI001D02F748|nr:uncharacterized protein LOC123082102 [Triticum aestivum]